MLGKSTSHSEYEEVLPKYTQNSVIAGCHTHGGAMLQSHQINVCHRDHQVKINQGLSGGSGGRTTIHIPQLIAPPISDTANSKANVKAAGGSLLNVHNNHQQTCGPNDEWCKNLGVETPQEGGSKKTKKKHHKKRKQNRKTKKINKKTKKNKNSNKNRKIKGILKKTKNSKNSKNSNKNKKSRKTKKVRFHK